VLNVLTQEWDMSKALDTRFMEGQEVANIKTARRLLAMGLKLEDVARGSDLPLERIKHLKPLTPDNAFHIPQ
jgi:hypothetical protein